MTISVRDSDRASAFGVPTLTVRNWASNLWSPMLTVTTWRLPLTPPSPPTGTGCENRTAPGNVSVTTTSCLVEWRVAYQTLSDPPATVISSVRLAGPLSA